MSYTTPIKTHRTMSEQRDRLPLYLREFYEKRQLDRIKIDGNEIQGYFEYSFLNEKTYVKSPERSANGSIENLNSYATFLTPRLIIKYNYMHIEDYRTLMRLLNSKNEFVVECYDIVLDERVVHKMYFATPAMPNIHQRYMEVLGVTDYTIELIGTNTDYEEHTLTYEFNIPSEVSWAYETVATQTFVHNLSDIVGGVNASYTNSESQVINISEETFNNKYVFQTWNTQADGKGMNYIDGDAYFIQNNITLYAIWKAG